MELVYPSQELILISVSFSSQSVNAYACLLITLAFFLHAHSQSNNSHHDLYQWISRSYLLCTPVRDTLTHQAASLPCLQLEWHFMPAIISLERKLVQELVLWCKVVFFSWTRTTLPDRTFHKFRVSESIDRRILFSSETPIAKFWSSELGELFSGAAFFLHLLLRDSPLLYQNMI